MKLNAEDKITVVCAAEFEAEPLLKLLHSRGQLADLVTLGIGPIAAAKEVIRSADKLKNMRVIFVGTCGTFGDFQQVQLITPRRIIWEPLGCRLGKGYLIDNTTPELSYQGSGLLDLTELESRDVVCGPEISNVDTLSEDLSSMDTVENLELYAAYPELQKFCKDLTILLGITNGIGPEAHKQWQDNHQQAANAAAEFVERKLFK